MDGSHTNAFRFGGGGGHFSIQREERGVRHKHSQTQRRQISYSKRKHEVAGGDCRAYMYM